VIVKVVWRSITTEPGAPSVAMVSATLTPVLPAVSLDSGKTTICICYAPDLRMEGAL